MRALLLLLIVVLTAGYVSIALFFAWMAIGWSGTGWQPLLFAAFWLATAGAVVAYGVSRWRRVRRDERVRV